ncbi:Pupal cuticle protein 27-like, partial [Homarus americanus]
ISVISLTALVTEQPQHAEEEEEAGEWSPICKPRPLPGYKGLVTRAAVSVGRPETMASMWPVIAVLSLTVVSTQSRPSLPSARVRGSPSEDTSIPSGRVYSSFKPGRSYSFKYDTPSSSRFEDADSNLNVKGGYSFRADDGRTRTISYIAGAQTGFVAQGDALPVAPEAGSVSSRTSGTPTVYSISGTPEEARLRSSVSPGGAYSFNYETPSSSRREEADPNLNVRGSYSFRSDDGRTRSITYKAGAKTGFVAEGDDLPVAPEAESVPLVPSGAPTVYSISGTPEEASLRSSVSPGGAYSFNYETPSSSRREEADPNLNVRGSYSFRSDDGRTRSITYKAGAKTGFVAEGDDLPVAPEAESVPLVPSGAPTVYSISGTPEEARLRSSVSPGGAYSFSYETPSSSRREEADPNLNVRGSYSFRSDDGRTRSITYKAGAKTGFVAEGDDLPVAPEAESVPLVPSGAPTVYSISGTTPEEARLRSSVSPGGAYSFNYETPSSSRREEADPNLNVRGSYSFRSDDGRTRSITYKAGAKTGFVAEGDDLPVAPEAESVPLVPSGAPTVYSISGTPQEARLRSSVSPGGAYSFNYETPSSSRREEADPNLNVRGSYSFRSDDGRTRSITYKAGAKTGFVAEGDDLPVAPEAESVPLVPSGAPTVYSISGTPEEARLRSSVSPGGAYSFNYETPSSSRREEADPNLNVRGSYSFRSDDGRTRSITYKAGAKTGFVAEGDDLPVAPEAESVPLVPSGAPTVYSISGTPQEARLRSSVSPGGAYSFNYETPSSSRREEADPNLNVRGSYSFRSDDGRTRSITYKAGAKTGFVAEGDDLPVAPEAESVPLVPSGAPTVYSISGTPQEARLRSSVSPGGAYSFNYETPSSSRREEADPNLNVRGSYSFRSDDGRTRSITYKAGAKTGFVAEGDDLPVAPEARSVSSRTSGTPTVYSISGTPQEASLRSSVSPGGAYSFNYETPSSSRREEADPNLNVRGSYSFRSDDGRTRSITYKAGAKTGFVAEGDDLPVAPEAESVPLVPSGAPTVYSISGTPEEARLRSSVSPGGAYSFSYETPSSSRREEADPNLNVRGSYSFRSDDGRTRSITYKAGAKTGFVAEGDDLPVAPEAESVPLVPSGAPTVYSISGTPQEASLRSSVSPGGAYSFNYETPSSSRREEADPNLNVRGSYSFRSDDGRTRSITYKAGAKTGFVAEGDDLPVAPEAESVPLVPSGAPTVYSISGTPEEARLRSSVSPGGAYSFSYETPSSSRREEADPNLNVRGSYSFRSDDGRTRSITYKAGAKTGFVANVEETTLSLEV